MRKKNVVVQEGFFFLTNHDQRYTLETNNDVTETFNIHFGEYFADQVLCSLSKDADQLLTSGFDLPFYRKEFYNKLYFRDGTFNQIVEHLRLAEDDNLLEEEKLYELLIHLLCQDDQVRKMAHHLPVMKNVTKQEITKRLIISTDYIYSNYDKQISLDELANICCLSKFHFLRLFKIAFKKTPHQFINEIKISRAKTLLKNQHLEVRAISSSLGFTNATSFSRVFYQQVGQYPTAFRNAAF